MELQCDPVKNLRTGKGRQTLFLNDPAQYFLSSPASCPFANIRLRALQAKFQIQVRPTLNKHGTSKKAIAEYGFCTSTLPNAVTNSAPSPPSMRTLREVARIEF